ncbi:hypothetical protein ACIBH1_45505 [Nonomuraea sp. NPDC050663]
MIAVALAFAALTAAVLLLARVRLDGFAITLVAVVTALLAAVDLPEGEDQ